MSTTSHPSVPAPEAGAPADERTWIMLAHLSGLFAFVGPLIVLLVQRDKGPAVTREAKEALNFQLTVAIATMAVLILGAVLSLVVVGLVLLMIAPFVPLVGVVFAIVAAVVSNRTGTYRYPLTLRMVK